LTEIFLRKARTKKTTGAQVANFVDRRGGGGGKKQKLGPFVNQKNASIWRRAVKEKKRRGKKRRIVKEAKVEKWTRLGVVASQKKKTPKQTKNNQTRQQRQPIRKKGGAVA